MTPEQFAQKIKAKYPQYKDIDDLTLATKVIQKYPEYSSSVQGGNIFESVQGESKPKTFLGKAVDKVSSFFGSKKLGQGVGQAAAFNGNDKLLNQSIETANTVLGNTIAAKKKAQAAGNDTTRLDKAIKMQQEVLNQLGGHAATMLNPNNLTEREVIGSAVQTAANFIPVGKLAKGAQSFSLAKNVVAPTIAKQTTKQAAIELGKKSVKGAATGYAFDVGAGLQNKDKTIKQAFTPGVGTVAGAALPFAGAALKKGGDLLTVKTPKQLVNYGLKVPPKYADKGVNEAFLKRKLGGKSLKGIYETTGIEVDAIEKKIQSKLTDKELVRTKDFAKSVADRMNSRTGGSLNELTLRSRIAKFVPDHASLLKKPRLSEKEANVLRKAIDNNLKEATHLGKKLTNEQKAVKRFADELRGLVQKATKTEKLFKQQSEAITLRDLADSAMKKAETQGRPGLLDLTAGGAGFAVGNIPGAAIGIAAQRIARSPRVQLAVAKILRNSGKARPILAKFAPAERKVILNLLARFRAGDGQ